MFILATQRSYADGVEVASAAKNWYLVRNCARIGRQVNEASEFWNGLIDDVRVYDTALSTDEVRQLAVGAVAGNPNPESGSAVSGNLQTLSLHTGERAVSHDLYLGTDRNDVRDSTRTTGGAFVINTTNTNHHVSNLDTGRIYFWRVDEHQSGGRILKGTVWSFLMELSCCDGFYFPDSSSIRGVVLNGNAFPYANVLRLTPAASYMTGSAWCSTKVHVDGGFETTCRFRLTDPSTPPADGFAFVVQNANWQALGGGGGNIGYAGTVNSLAVEFDVWDCSRSFPDSPAPHVSVQTRGMQGNDASHSFSLGCATGIPNIADGAVHTARVSYRGGTLNTFVDSVGQTSPPCLSARVELNDLLGLVDGKAWVGFTAATGSLYENHDILDWEFRTLKHGMVLVVR